MPYSHAAMAFASIFPPTLGAPPRRSRALALAILAALSLGGCSSLNSLGSLNPMTWFESKPDFEASLPELRPMAKPTPERLMRVAEITRKQGDFLSSAALYRRVIEMRPGDPKPMIGLARVLLDGGDAGNSAAVFRAVLEQGPGNVTALHGLGNVLIVLRRPRAAAKRFTAALAVRASGRSYNGLGVALDMIGNRAAARKAYRNGLRIDPESLSLRNNLGLSLALSGRYKAAVAMLRGVAADPRSTARERQNLALTYGLSGDPEMAARIARIDLGEAQVADNLGYYAWLRKQPSQVAAAALGRGPAPKVGALGDMADGGSLARAPFGQMAAVKTAPARRAAGACASGVTARISAGACRPRQGVFGPRWTEANIFSDESYRLK